MKSVLGIAASKPKPSPLEGSGNFRVLPAESNPQQISRREWWLWLSALFVTILSSVAFLLSSFTSFFRHADHFYEIRSDQARWATLCLLLVFNAWLVYRQWSFRRLRKQSAAQSLDAQAMPQQFSEAAGLDPITGLYTRSSLEQHLGKEVARARRQNSALSLATLHVPIEKGQPRLGHCRAPRRRRFPSVTSRMRRKRGQTGIKQARRRRSQLLGPKNSS
jgi:hypothetical protein